MRRYRNLRPGEGMVRFVTLLFTAVFVTACGTTVEHRRITLSDVDPKLGEQFESEDRVNALHPANLGPDGARDGDISRIVWTDFCQDKECGETAMTYSRLLRQVAITAATVEQLSFIARQLDTGEVTAQEVEAFLELGWDQLPAMARRVERQRRTLAELDPDRDFRRNEVRSQAWGAIENAAGQLERAESKIEGLDDVIGAVYRELEPAFACAEPDPGGGVVLSLSPETKRRLEEITRASNGEKGALFSEGEQGALQHVISRGLESLERDVVTRERFSSLEGGPVIVTRLDVDGPLDPFALRVWFNARMDAVASCLPSTAERAREFEVLAVYSPETVLADVHDATRKGDDTTADCIVEAVEAAVGDQDAEHPGSVRVGLVLRPPNPAASDSRRQP